MSLDSPKVTVLMPVYNVEKYLREAIDSILNQTFVDFEFLIINDASTDSTKNIILSYNDPRIRLINNDHNIGLAAGLFVLLNQGIELAKGEYIARMDGDDISYPQRFEKQIKLLEKENADICGCHFYIINRNGNDINKVICPITEESFILSLSLYGPFAHGSVIMRKSFLEKNKLKYGLTVKYAEDYALWIDFYNHGARFCNVNDFLYKHRDINTSVSKVKKKKFKEDTDFLRKLFIKQNKQKCISAYQNLINMNLSVRERELLVLSSYLLTKYCYNGIFFEVLKNSRPKELVHGFLKFLIKRIKLYL